MVPLHKRTSEALLKVGLVRKKSRALLSDMGCLRKSVQIESCYLKASPPPTGDSWARARLQPVAMSGTVLDGRTSFYLLTTGVLLFPRRWPIHSQLPLTLSFFLPLNGRRKPPGSIQRQWTASDQQNISQWCLQARSLRMKPKGIGRKSLFAADGSAVEPQIIFIFCLRWHAQMMPWPGSSGTASIDRSGLIEGNVERWVKGLWLGSDQCLLVDRVCMLTICRATESCWKLQVPLGTFIAGPSRKQQHDWTVFK